MNKYEKEAEQAIAALASHEDTTRRAIQAAFHLHRDPLRSFAECLAHTSVVHVRSVNALQRAQADEFRTIVQQLEDRMSTLDQKHRVVVFDFWVREPEQAIRFLLYAVAGALVIGLIVGRLL